MGEHTMLDSLYWHIRSWDEIERTSLFTLSNWVTIFLLLLFTVIAIIQTRSKILRILSLSYQTVGIKIWSCGFLALRCPDRVLVFRKYPT